MALPIITTANKKIIKSGGVGYLTGGIHLAPASLSGHNVCGGSSAGCRLACLNRSGHGVYERTQKARLKKTNWFFNERENFMAQLIKDIHAVKRKAAREGLEPAIRLNLTSDIQWENIIYQGKTIFQHFPEVSFYDYTKIIKRVLPDSKAHGIKNYHLTFSRSESNQSFTELAMAAGANVAVVFEKLPKKYLGRRVIDGTKDDARFLDPKKVVVGLIALGKAKKDTSGFVVR
jgi:hypothetical protein